MIRSRFARWSVYAAIALIGILFVAQSFGVSGNSQAAQVAVANSTPNVAADMTGADWAVIGMIIAGLCFFLFRARRRLAASYVSAKRCR